MQRLLAYLLRLEQEDRIVDRERLIEVGQEAGRRQYKGGQRTKKDKRRGWAFYSSTGGIWRWLIDTAEFEDISVPSQERDLQQPMGKGFLQSCRAHPTQPL